MEKELYDELLNVISGYYPITNQEDNLIKEIVSDKINHLEDRSSFKLLCEDFETIGSVEDFSYLQFPNRKLILEEIEDVGVYRIYKNFAVCISLLGPYYTFFYEYQFRVKNEKGFFLLSHICFLKDEKFKSIKKNFDLEKIDSMIKSRYPNHSYVNHYHLLMNEIDKGVPFGQLDLEKKMHSMFLYLFDNVFFDNYFR